MDSKQFNETKNALLRYSASNQTSQGARLIGVAIALFTLIQTVQHSMQEPLSGTFSDAGAILFGLARALGLSQIAPSFIVTLKLILFGSILLALLFFVIRSIFRFAVFTYFSDYLIRVKSNEISETEPIHDAIRTAVFDKMEEAEQTVYWVFPLIWFVSRGKEKSQHRKGLASCLFFAIFSTLVLMSFLFCQEYRNIVVSFAKQRIKLIFAFNLCIKV